MFFFFRRDILTVNPKGGTKMLMLNRKKAQIKKTVGISVAILLAAHLAAGVLLCAGMPKESKWQKTMKNAKRTVVGLVKEIV